MCTKYLLKFRHEEFKKWLKATKKYAKIVLRFEIESALLFGRFYRQYFCVARILIMRNILDLSGKWDFRFCSGDLKSEQFSDSIMLPGTTSAARKGKLNEKAETGHLTDIYKFEGTAAFRKTVVLPTAADGEKAVLHLERTRLTTLEIDGKAVGSKDSLCTSHNYDITAFCDGKEHSVVIYVSNVGYKTRGGHMTSPDTQTNWLGITGKLEVRVFGKVFAENVRITPHAQRKEFSVTADICGAESGSVLVKACCGDSEAAREVLFSDSTLETTICLGENAKLWSEFERNLYDITIDTGSDVFSTKAGLRDFEAIGDKFYINGRKTFLRGKHDGLIFPLTGYAPTDTDEWVRILEISKSYGINHYRFHTCCPPRAAFEAADIVGIYMEPELPFWGSIHAKDEDGFNSTEQEYLIEEGKAILREFGNHPSFCMMSMGNELWGSPERINEIMGILRQSDPRPLYTMGSNCFQFVPCTVENDDFFCGVRLSRERLIRGSYAMCDAPLGHVQTQEPSTMKDYDSEISASSDSVNSDGNDTIQIQYETGVKTVKASSKADSFTPDVPIVTHEIGQYETYPDFTEIEKYTGPLKARNFEIFRERLEEKGLSHLAQDYFKASGRLAMDCYKEELEAVLRSKKLAGCQILDIQDFAGQGTALVGVLNALMENKGIITDAEWREFFSQTVILARFEKYVYTVGEGFEAKVQLCDFGNESLVGKTLRWSLGIHSGSFTIGEYENYCDIGTISVPAVSDKDETLTLRLSIEDTDIRNHYDIRVLPKVDSVDYEGVTVVSELDDNARQALKRGETVLLARVPDEDKSIEGFYCQDFWCYPMFRSISQSMGRKLPVGTMGLLIDNTHPSLAGFKSEMYSTPQWFKTVMNSRSEILDDMKDKRVIVRTIDNFERNHDLALIYEYDLDGGKVLVVNCKSDVLTASPEGRVLLKSLTDYAKNNA